MSDSLMQNLQEQLQPLKQLVEINNKAMEKLIRQQNQYMNDMLQTSVEQASKLSKPTDVDAFVKNQQAFVESMSSKLIEAAQRNMEVMNETREATAKLLQDTVKNASRRGS